MKLQLTQANLAKALGTVGRIVSTRTSLPVLSNVLLTAENGRLRLAATNLEIGISCWIGCRIDEEGSLTIPARLLSEFVSSLPPGNVDLSSREDTLSIRTSHYSSQINGITADEFPLIPQLGTRPVLKLPAQAFRDALGQVVIAASLDEARPVLAGVYMYIDDGALYIVATDSYRLAEKRLELSDAPDASLRLIVPARTMQELSRILGEGAGELEIYLDENQVMFRVGDIELISRLIEGQFPNYRSIIPNEVETTIELPTAEFARITKVAALFARESAGSVRLEVRAEGEVSIVSSDSEVGSGTSKAECEVYGEDAEVSLNARYITDALGAIKTNRVQFSIAGKLAPCVLRPLAEGEAEADEDYLHIVMPLRT